VGSIPDGLLRSDFSFQLYIESKVKRNSVDRVQLDEHRKLLAEGNRFLVYVTPDEVKPVLPDDVYWGSWKKVSESFSQYLQNEKVPNLALLVFLTEQFNTLLANMGLLGERWSLDNEQVLVVAGSSGEDLALRRDIYICQNHRRFRPSRYLTFYNNARIQYLFEVVSEPLDDVDVTKEPKFKEFLQELNPEHGPRRLFHLKRLAEVGPIINDSTDRNGSACPYTYGQPRYTTLDRIRRAKRTSDL
jgi:hypothetical protein